MTDKKNELYLCICTNIITLGENSGKKITIIKGSFIVLCGEKKIKAMYNYNKTIFLIKIVIKLSIASKHRISVNS